jgi:glucose/arabinose dehydrogenase
MNRLIPAVVLAAGSSVAALPPLEAEVYVSGLNRITDFAQHPSDPSIQYVTEQGGTVRIIEDGVLRGQPVVDITPLMNIGFSEHGLVSIALPPDHGDTGNFYLMYTGLPNFSSQTRRFTLDLATFTADASDNAFITRLNQPSVIHNGNAMRFDGEGDLYISYGDGGPIGDPNGQGQNSSTLYGTIARITPDPAGGYTIPAGNPFVGTSNADEILHYGLRNVWKFSIDEGPCSTGGLLMGDVGDTQVEELNFALPDEPGQNFGWACLEGSVPFAGCAAPPGETFTPPLFEYDRAAGLGTSVTAGYVYRGRDMPHHRGRVFFGDFISGRVLSLELGLDPITGDPVASDLVDHTAELAASLGSGLGLVVGFGRDAQGELYVINYNGAIYRLSMQGEPEDIDLDGAVGASDLARLIGAWGPSDCAPEDLSNDGMVGAADLARLIGAWGAAR